MNDPPPRSRQVEPVRTLRAADRPGVLVVEDDPVIGVHLDRALEAGGYRSWWARTAAEGRQMAERNSPDLVLLDLGLPDGDGVDLAREIRVTLPDTVIVVLTARDTELDVISGLDAGADDYLTKPFRLFEVLARIRAHLRRQGVVVSADRGTGDLLVDRASRRVTCAATEVRLRPKEFDVLAYLADRVGQAVSRSELMERVWDEQWFGSTKTLDVTVASLRQRLTEAGARGPGSPVLVTLRGFGYRLDPPPGDAGGARRLIPPGFGAGRHPGAGRSGAAGPGA